MVGREGVTDRNEKSLPFCSKQFFLLRNYIFAATDVLQSPSQVLLLHKGRAGLPLPWQEEGIELEERPGKELFLLSVGEQNNK